MRSADDRHWYEIYEGKERLVDEVSRCGLAEFAKGTRQAFGDKRGSDPSCFEFYFVIRGSLCMQLDGQQLDVPSDNVLVVKPGQNVAGGGPGFAVEPCHVCWMVLRPKGRKGKTQGDLVAFARDLTRIDRAAFPVSRDTLHCCSRLITEHRRRDRRSIAIVRALVDLVATGIIRDYERLLDEDGERQNWTSSRIASLLERIDAENNYGVSITDMARQCKLSHSYFCRVFAQAYGTTPAEYLARIRVKKARVLLEETDSSVTDIAMNLGFSSSQYFATVFRKYSDFTPTAYRRNSREQGGGDAAFGTY